MQQQKYYAWKLLERALAQSFGWKLNELDVSRNQNGKWECSACYFSLSHSGNVAAVAVAKEPVGVDIEAWNEARFTDALAEKIATAREREALDCTDRKRAALNALWTKKEAIFKRMGERAFRPKLIEASEYATVTKAIQSGNERYLLSVACNNLEQAMFCGEGVEVLPFELY